MTILYQKTSKEGSKVLLHVNYQSSHKISEKSNKLIEFREFFVFLHFWGKNPIP